MNEFEKKLKLELEKENPDCVVLRNGWPDFAVVEKKTGKIRKAVEGKGMGDFVKPHQAELHKALRISGIQVEVRYAWGNGSFGVEEKTDAIV